MSLNQPAATRHREDGLSPRHCERSVAIQESLGEVGQMAPGLRRSARNDGVVALKRVEIGGVVESVATTNPGIGDADDTFVYIDIGAVDRTSKAIKTPSEITRGEAPSRARQLIQCDDILVSTVRPNLNAVALVQSELNGAIASTGFCVLRAQTSKIYPRFLFQWVQTPTFIDEMMSKASGASYPAVSDKIVLNSKIPLPPLPEQRRIAAILDQADALRARRRAALAQLDEMAQAIFVEMFGDPVTNTKGWPDTRVLGDVADIASGITKGRKTAEASLRSVPYLAVSNVQDRLLDLRVVKTIEATEGEISRYRLQPSDIVLTEGGDPDKLGRGVLWSGEIAECIHQNHIFRVRIQGAELHPVFAVWLIGSQRGKRYFLTMAKQTTGIASINMGQLRRFPLLIPPLNLQQSFADRLVQMDAVKLKASMASEETESLFASLQHRAFRGEL